MGYVLEFGKEKKWDNIRDFFHLVETLVTPEKEDGLFRLMEQAPKTALRNGILTPSKNMLVKKHKKMRWLPA